MEHREVGWEMIVPMAFFAGLALLLGLFPGPVRAAAEAITAAIFHGI